MAVENASRRIHVPRRPRHRSLQWHRGCGGSWFSLSLRLELKGTGIRVAAVCPGATRTEFFDVARGDIPFAAFIDRLALPPEIVARSIYLASRGDRALVFPSLGARLLFLADRWLPALSEAGNLSYRNQVLRAAAGGKGR